MTFQLSKKFINIFLKFQHCIFAMLVAGKGAQEKYYLQPFCINLDKQKQETQLLPILQQFVHEHWPFMPYFVDRSCIFYHFKFPIYLCFLFGCLFSYVYLFPIL